MLRRPPGPTLFPYATLFRSRQRRLRPQIDFCRELREIDWLRDHVVDARGDARLDHVVERRDGKGRRTPIIAVTALDDVNEPRSEEHTSELQSQSNLLCRLLL